MLSVSNWININRFNEQQQNMIDAKGNTVFILNFLWHICVTVSVQAHLLPKHLNSTTARQIVASSQEKDDEDMYSLLGNISVNRQSTCPMQTMLLWDKMLKNLPKQQTWLIIELNFILLLKVLVVKPLVQRVVSFMPQSRKESCGSFFCNWLN